MNLCNSKTVFTVFLILSLCALLADTRLCQADAVDQKVNALRRRAMAYSKKGNHSYALKCFDQAIHLEPGNLELYYGRAFALGRAGNYVMAIKNFTFVIKKDEINAKRNKTTRKFSHAPRFRADCYMAIGNMQRAAKDYIKFHGGFQKSTSKDGKVWSYLAEAFCLMGRNDLALKAIQKGLATGGFWTGRLKGLQKQILTGKQITPHKPLSN